MLGLSHRQQTAPPRDRVAAAQLYKASLPPVILFRKGMAFGYTNEDAAVAVKIRPYSAEELIGARISRDKAAIKTLHPPKMHVRRRIKKTENHDWRKGKAAMTINASVWMQL